MTNSYKTAMRQPERFAPTTPMTEEQYEEFHARTALEYGLEAKAKRAAEHGGSLMVKSLAAPNISVPYEQFKEETAQKPEEPVPIVDK